MAYIHDYVRQNPSALVRGYVPIARIIDRIKGEYNAIDISPYNIPNLAMHRFNAVHLPSNEILNLTEEQLQVKAIKIPITEASKHYTTKDYVPVNAFDDAEKDYIYLAYEEQVRYLYSNSNKLFLEAVLARGIQDEDIKNGTEEYACYLFYLKCYLEHTNQIPDDK